LDSDSLNAEQFIRRTVASSPSLLEPAEEIELLKRCQELCDLLESNVGQRRITAESIALVKPQYPCLVADGLRARDIILTANQRLAIEITNRTLGNLAYLSDFYQEAFTGLLRAIESFDCTKGFRFSTYAVFWIKQKVLYYYYLRHPFIKVPTECRAIVTKYKALMLQFKSLPFNEAHDKAVDTVVSFLLEDNQYAESKKEGGQKLLRKIKKLRDKVVLSLSIPEVYSAEECPRKIERIPYLTTPPLFALDLEIQNTLNPLQRLFFTDIIQKLDRGEDLNDEELQRIDMFTATFERR
jgi:RNA polymerase sigma factor (sigma-70 family)